MTNMCQAFVEHDFFRSNQFVIDPNTYLGFPRLQSPVMREPHQAIVMVTCYDERLTVDNNPRCYSSIMSASSPRGRA